MRQNINIDNLARLARERNDEPSWRSLWNAVVHLPEWFALGTTERPDAPAILRGGEAGKPVLFAFTDQPRARRFVDRAPPLPGGVRLMTVIRMPMPHALRYAAGLGAHGVEHIVFNAGHKVDGFGFPVASIARLAEALGRPVSQPEAPAPAAPEQPPTAPSPPTPPSP